MRAPLTGLGAGTLLSGRPLAIPLVTPLTRPFATGAAASIVELSMASGSEEHRGRLGSVLTTRAARQGLKEPFE